MKSWNEETPQPQARGDARKRNRGAAWFRLLVTAAVLAAPAAGRAQEEAERPLPIQKLRVPLDFYDDGSVRTQVRAGQARIPKHGDIEAFGIRLEFLTPAGEIETLVLLNHGWCNRDERKLRSRSKVRLERKGVLITGTGLAWDAKEQKVTILDNVRVVLDHTLGLKAGGE
jgi:hypothetical protein